MAAKNPTKLILDGLSDLKKIELEEFCSALLDRREEPRIHRNAIEDKSIVQITDKLTATFTEEGAVEVTMKILKEINCYKVAQDLENWMEQARQAVNRNGQLESDLKSLKDNMNKYKEFQQKYNKVIQLNKKQVATTEKQVKAEIEKLHQFLREEEKTRLEALKAEEKQKAEIVTSEMEYIKEKISSLSDNISATEQELQNPSGSFHRDQCPLSEPQMVLGVTIDVAKHLGNLTYGVWEKMKEKVKFTPVILDPNTAHPRLCLSEDLTSVRNTSIKQQVPDNPERFTEYATVLGSEGYSSGKHSWEVEVGAHPNWVIGLVKESVDRKGHITDTPKHGIWCLCQKSGKYDYGTQTQIPMQRNPQRIRVELDYDMGEVSFLDTEDKTHPIYTHYDTFTEKLYPYFTIPRTDDAETIDIKVCQLSRDVSLQDDTVMA